MIITDTREKLPYFKIKFEKLEVGDYTTDVLKNKIHIERKSLQDLYGTLVQGNGRFKYELFRAAYYHITLYIYVEGGRVDFVAKKFPCGNDRKFSSSGLDKLISTFEIKYFAKFVWCANRKDCKTKVKNALLLAEKMMLKNNLKIT